jgi:hypothetical protein
VLRNLLRGEPLYQGFTQVFETGPRKWFLGGESDFPGCARDLLKDLSEPGA